MPEQRLRRQEDIDHIITLTGELGMTKEGLKNLSEKMDALINRLDKHTGINYCSSCVPNKYFWHLVWAVCLFGVAAFIGIDKAMIVIKGVASFIKRV